MKKSVRIFNIVALLLLTFNFLLSPVFAQAPQSFKYQAVVRDGSGNLIANQSVNIRVSIRETSAGGTVVYQESFNPTTTQYGLVNLNIGAGTVISGTFNTIIWGAHPYYIQIEVNTGSGYVDMGATQLLSVPYALFAQNAAVPGVAGPTGPIGPTGPAGTNGTNGATGATGAANISGTTNYLVKFTAATTGGNSAIYEGTGTYAGNIGIGTTGPNSKLHINGTTGEDAFRIQVGGSTKHLLGSNGGTTLGVFSSGAPANGLYVNGQTLIGVSSGTAGTLYQVGAKLQVQTNTKYAGYFSTDSLYSASYAIYAKHTATGSSDTRAVKGEAKSSDGWGYGGDFEGGDRGVNAIGSGGAYTGVARGLYAYASGTAGSRYGVYGYAYNNGGTSAYGVYGTASGATNNYGVYCSGNGVYTGTWTQSSDIKLKKNIKSLSGALDKIKLLEPKEYEMRREEYPSMNLSEGKQFGLIAQDLEKVFPEMVHIISHPDNMEKGKETMLEFKGIDYISLVPVLIQAIKEQQQQIEELKSIINSK